MANEVTPSKTQENWTVQTDTQHIDFKGEKVEGFFSTIAALIKAIFCQGNYVTFQNKESGTSESFFIVQDLNLSKEDEKVQGCCRSIFSIKVTESPRRHDGAPAAKATENPKPDKDAPAAEQPVLTNNNQNNSLPVNAHPIAICNQLTKFQYTLDNLNQLNSKITQKITAIEESSSDIPDYNKNYLRNQINDLDQEKNMWKNSFAVLEKIERKKENNTNEADPLIKKINEILDSIEKNIQKCKSVLNTKFPN